MSLPSAASPDTAPAAPDELAAKKALLQQTEQAIVTSESTLQSLLDGYRKLLTRNAELIYISLTTQMSDAQLAQFFAQVETLQNPAIDGPADATLQLVMGTDSFLIDGTQNLLKFLVNLRGIVANGWVPAGMVGSDMTAQLLSDLGQELYDSGVVSESDVASFQSLLALAAFSNVNLTQQSVAAATSASLVTTVTTGGGTSGLTTWIDMHSPPGQSPLDLEDQKTTILTSFLDAVTAKVTGINNNMVAQIGLFNQLSSDMLKLLPTERKPDFSTSIPATLESLDACFVAQQRAVAQFAVSAVLRNIYVNMLKHNPKPPRQHLIGETTDVCVSRSRKYVEQVLTEISAKYSAGIASTT